MFQTVPLSIIGCFSLYTQQWYTSYRFADSLRARKLSAKPVWHSIAVCTVWNSRWWTEELSEICRVLFQNKFEKLVHLVGFTIRMYHDARSSEHQKRKVSCRIKLIPEVLIYFGMICRLMGPVTTSLCLIMLGREGVHSLVSRSTVFQSPVFVPLFWVWESDVLVTDQAGCPVYRTIDGKYDIKNDFFFVIWRKWFNV